MPIGPTDIKYKLSGGAANSDPLLSIGGAMSSVDRPSGIFDDVSPAEATSGDAEYRCIYILNNHGSLVAQNAKIWIQVQTPSGDTDVAIGLAVAGLNAVETAVANENTAPAGVTFSAPSNLAGSLSLGNIPAGGYYGVWERRTVNPAAAGVADSYTLRVYVETNP